MKEERIHRSLTYLRTGSLFAVFTGEFAQVDPLLYPGAR